ncbi:hypothetical protein NUW58_g4285 [Xylaria curta]|uniref:Uncharacterized protein n=1 Tax=Xylaria curta TaxID=42375 RepID=A0ACC1P9L7_9PEZI|nr:hypothetical protein NUW58_g4285 [Xylaria curta]
MAELMLTQAPVQGPQEDPWAAIVLSLDGGGVRGLSSLYILREIMKEIKRLDDEAPAGDRLEQGSNGRLPLPCHYFDFIIGTSTGGLIAIMLGRLRMGVTDCIQQYWVLSNAIFRPTRQRYLQLYSRKKVQNAAKEVVKKYCSCHQGEDGVCNGGEDLRQYDYDEEGTRSSNPALANKTCRVAVLTVREGGITTFEPRQNDKLILFRSYNHSVQYRTNLSSQPKELNPRTLENCKLRIHEACSATSAAPTYFRSVWLRGRKFIDGGVQANNPSIHAWNEATQMAYTTPPHALVSIGTGMSKKYDRFSIRSFICFVARNITDTERDHETARGLPGPGRYFRFNVPEGPLNTVHKGLAKIKLSACKKKHKRPWHVRVANRLSQKQPASPAVPNLLSDANPTNGSETNTTNTPAVSRPPTRRETSKRVKEVAAEDECLRRDVEEKRKGGFKPSKYDYKTFDDIRDRTIQYCNSIQEGEQDNHDIKKLIISCATMLREQSLRRRNLERAGTPGVRSFTQFRKHPNPKSKRTEW